MQIPEQQHRKSRLLLIEDDPIVRAFIFKVLGPEGYEVVQADGALSARNILSFDTKFDCILLDLGLEDGEGLDLMSELRERPELRHVP
ncbi:MAG: response regulator, partial [Quisquiliibacterium sp.]